MNRVKSKMSNNGMKSINMDYVIDYNNEPLNDVLEDNSRINSKVIESSEDNVKASDVHEEVLEDGHKDISPSNIVEEVFDIEEDMTDDDDIKEDIIKINDISKDESNVMKSFVRSGLTFVGDVYWPTPHNGKFPNIVKVKGKLGLTHVVKIKQGSLVMYGYSQNHQLSKKTYSIGALLLNLYEEVITDIIIVAKLSASSAAIVSVKDGYIIPFGGDIISSIENVRLKVIELIETFAIGNIWTVGFGNYLYNDADISMKLRSVNSYFTLPSDEAGINLSNIWQHPKINNAIKNSQLQVIHEGIINRRNILVFTLLSLIVIMAFVAKEYLNKVALLEQPVVSHLVIPEATNVSSIDFVMGCLQDANMYFGHVDPFQFTRLNCDLHKQVATFFIMQTSIWGNNSAKAGVASQGLMSQGGQLIKFFNDQIDSKRQISDLNIQYNKDNMIITRPIKFPVSKHNSGNKDSNLDDLIENLQKLNAFNGTTFTLEGSGNQLDSSLNSHKAKSVLKFKIVSNLSPLWFIDNGFLTNQVYLTSLSAELDNSTGYYKWNLNGEIL